jgi:hypothetical protein
LKTKLSNKGLLLIALVVIAALSGIGFAAVLEYALNVPSTVVVVRADPMLELIANDNTTVVTSISFGSIVQGETGTWSGYLKNIGNVVLRTFSIGSSDIGSVGTVTWNLPSSGYLSVNQTTSVSIALSINQTATPGSHAFTVQITGSPNVSGPTNVAITASDPNDPYPRFWGLVFDRAMPPLVSFQGFVGADFNDVHSSGNIMTVQWALSTGAHYLIFGVSQTGGLPYGFYSGNITINGNTNSFTDIYGDHTVRIDFMV